MDILFLSLIFLLLVVFFPFSRGWISIRATFFSFSSRQECAPSPLPFFSQSGADTVVARLSISEDQVDPLSGRSDRLRSPLPFSRLQGCAVPLLFSLRDEEGTRALFQTEGEETSLRMAGRVTLFLFLFPYVVVLFLPSPRRFLKGIAFLLVRAIRNLFEARFFAVFLLFPPLFVFRDAVLPLSPFFLREQRTWARSQQFSRDEGGRLSPFAIGGAHLPFPLFGTRFKNLPPLSGGLWSEGREGVSLYEEQKAQWGPDFFSSWARRATTGSRLLWHFNAERRRFLPSRAGLPLHEDDMAFCPQVPVASAFTSPTP